MGFDIDKLRKIAKPCNEDVLDRVRSRRENRKWLHMSQDIALCIHYFLRTKNMKQKTLAEKMNVSPAYVAKLLKGGENLTLETISKIQDIIGENLIEVTEPYTDKTTLSSSSVIQMSFKIESSNTYVCNKKRISVDSQYTNGAS